MSPRSRKITRAIVHAIVSISAGGVTSSAIRAHREDENVFQSAQTVIGSTVLGWAAGDIAANYMDKKLDELFGMFDEVAETDSQHIPD